MGLFLSAAECQREGRKKEERERGGVGKERKSLAREINANHFVFLFLMGRRIMASSIVNVTVNGIGIEVRCK